MGPLLKAKKHQTNSLGDSQHWLLIGSLESGLMVAVFQSVFALRHSQESERKSLILIIPHIP